MKNITQMVSIVDKSLLDLPRELHHCIFNYLDIETILCSIRLVCKELYEASTTYDKLRLNVSSISTSKLRSLARIVQPNHIISLVLINKDPTEFSEKLNLFFSSYRLNQFTRLQSMTLVELNSLLLDRCLQHINRCRLTSLSITFRQQTSTETVQMTQLISSMIEQSSLQYLNLNIENAQIIIDDLFRPIHNTLRHLIINMCTYQHYQYILGNCTRLRKLVVGNCVIPDSGTITMMPVPSNELQLTSLTLYRWSSSINQLDFLLFLTPSLTFLKIISRKSSHLSLFNGDTWQQVIEHRLTRLRTLEIFFTYEVSEISSNPSLHSILISFKTPFWLNEKRWFVFCEYHLSLSEITLYTTPRYINDSERVIRYDIHPSNNSYSILRRHWTKDPEYAYTEEVEIHFTYC